MNRALTSLCKISFVTTNRLLSTSWRNNTSLTLCTVEEGVCRITLNNEKKRNVLSLSMLEELKEEFSSASNDENVQVIILDHKGPVFSSGHDLKELTAANADSHVKIFQRCTKVMNLIQDMHVPVIAEVKGVATAAGCQLVATCDLAIASNNSSFAVPGVTIGLFCSTPSVALSRSVSRKQALKMLLTGEPITAQEALTSGLINEVVPEDDLREATSRLAGLIARHSRSVIGIGKRAFYNQIKQDRDGAYCLMENVMCENLLHGDAQEGIQAFLQKRRPVWRK